MKESSDEVKDVIVWRDGEDGVFSLVGDVGSFDRIFISLRKEYFQGPLPVLNSILVNFFGYAKSRIRWERR